MKSTSPKPQTEREILESVEMYFRQKGFETVPQVRIRTWKPDLILTKGNDIIIVEAKGPSSDLRRALATVSLYATDATAAYLAVPGSRVSDSLKDAAKALGIGLAAVNDARVKIAVKGSSTTPRPSFARRIRGASTKSRDHGSHRWKRAADKSSFARLLKQRNILRVLTRDISRRFTIRELAEQAKAPYSTTWRTVATLRSLGVVSLVRVGQNQSIVVNRDSPFLTEIIRMSSKEISPHFAAARLFADRVQGLPEVRQVILFGSVAEGRENPESDIDIAILTSRKTNSLADNVRAIASEVEERTRLRIVPTFVSSTELESNDQLRLNIAKGEVLFERP